MSKLLDSKFNIGPFRFGIDSLIGLIPGIGDGVGTALSSYIVFKAWSMNMSKATITRMILNVAIDSVIGAIPILGDMFDIFWRANLRNTALMEKELANPRGQKQRSVLWLLMMIAILVALFYVCVVLPITMIF